MKHAALASLAILKVNWDRLGRDYFDNLLPFVVEAIRLSPDDVVSLPDTQQRVQNEFGLSIGPNVLRTLFNRAAKAGAIELRAGVFVRSGATSTSSPFEDLRKDTLLKYSKVLTDLCVFVRDKHARTWSVDEAETALLRFLGSHTLALIFASVDQAPFQLPTVAPENADFLVGDYVAHARANDPDRFSDIETLMKGLLLTNALFLPDISAVQQRFDRTRVFLDSPLLIFGSGYAGANLQAPVLELIALLRENGAKVCCFEHTVDEARGSLDACAHRIRHNLLRDAYGPSMEYFLETGLSPSDIDLLSARLPQKAASLGIEVFSNPPYEPSFVVDERGFEDAAQEALHYYNPKARQHDVDSIAAIARLRRGHDSTTVERSRAVFVTNNVALAKCTRKFFQSDSPPGAIALCISDHAMASILWLKNPTKAPNLPSKRLIADAYAALQPSNALWRLYLVEISKLQEDGVTSADEYYVLRHAQAAKRALMDLTQGDLAAFSEGTVHEIIARAKENLTADLKDDLAGETRRSAALERSIVDLQTRRAMTDARVMVVASRIGRTIAALTLAVGGIVLSVGIVSTFPWSLPSFQAAWWRYLLGAAQALLLVFTLLGLFFDTTLRTIVARVSEKTTGVVARTIRRLFNLDEDSTEARRV